MRETNSVQLRPFFLLNNLLPLLCLGDNALPRNATPAHKWTQKHARNLATFFYHLSPVFFALKKGIITIVAWAPHSAEGSEKEQLGVQKSSQHDFATTRLTTHLIPTLTAHTYVHSSCTGRRNELLGSATRKVSLTIGAAPENEAARRGV